MRDGRLVDNGPADQIITAPRPSELYGVPVRLFTAVDASTNARSTPVRRSSAPPPRRPNFQPDAEPSLIPTDGKFECVVGPSSRVFLG
jgi:hypothetical protein